jgi:type VI secretion system secreted protein Hcp
MLNMYLKVDKIKGQTKTKGFEDQIELLAYSHGVHQSVTSNPSNQHRTSGSPNISDLSFTKYQDIASAGLLSACLTAEDLKTVVLTVGRMDDKVMKPAWVITMDNAIVSSVSYGGSGGEDIATENLTLNFASAKWEFKQQQVDGSLKGQTTASWSSETVTGDSK